MKHLLKFLGGLFLVTGTALGIFFFANQVPDRSVKALKDRWAQPPSQFIDIGGMQVHLRDEGRKENLVPIVLLHGTSASLHTWEGWVQALKKEHRVIRFDMPAFGLTGPSPENQYTIQDYAAVVIAVLDRLRVNTCVLAGNSLGGYAAWVTALLYPDRIQRLVLVDASGYPYKSNSVPLGFIIARTPVLNRLAKNLLPRKLVETSLKNVYANPLLVTQDLVDRYFDLTTRAGNRQALAQRFSQTQPGSLAGRIPELKQPTLILWGVQDRLIPIAMGERFHREIADSKFISFDHLGHVPQEEDPQATVAALKQFLAETKVFNAQK